jgi:hypothetical protein
VDFLLQSAMSFVGFWPIAHLAALRQFYGFGKLAIFMSSSREILRLSAAIEFQSCQRSVKPLYSAKFVSSRSYGEGSLNCRASWKIFCSRQAADKTSSQGGYDLPIIAISTGRESIPRR